MNATTRLKSSMKRFDNFKWCSTTEELSSLMIPLFFITFVKTLTMQILQKSITRAEPAALAENTFGDMIKCVADVRLGSLALDAELHADLERLLLENGSAEEDLWGFNLYPDIREAIKRLVEQFIIG